jgi:hypothetical protein
MQNKGNIPFEDRAKARARGLLTEQHVVGWFKRQWPDQFEEPDNLGQWQKPCSHDFKLHLREGTVLVDVAGENRNHEFHLTPGKSITDLHVYAAMDDTDNNIALYGFRRGVDWHGVVLPEWTQPIQRLIFRLNVEKAGLDITKFRNGVVL